MEFDVDKYIGNMEKIEIKIKHDNLVNLNNKTHQNMSISTLTSTLWPKY